MLSLLFIIDFHTTVWVLSVSISKNQFWTFPKRGSGSAFPGGACALHGCKGTYITTCKRRKERMRKFSLAALLLLFCGTFAVAQESKGEFYAGWSFQHFDCGSGCTDSKVPGGFDLGGAYYLSRNIGAVADFDYHHKDLSDVAA